METISEKQTRYVSVTHRHLLTTITTLLDEAQFVPRDGCVRILDIGCGDGQLIGHLQSGLSAAFPHLRFEIHGFDIGEQGYNEGSQFDAAAQALSRQHPQIEWRERLCMISDQEPWRYPSDFFDIATSNQVVEHVSDLPAFLAELSRCLAPEGTSVHLFPLAHCIMEAHCQTPFAHWIRDFDRRVDWIAFLSRLRIGAYRRHSRILGHDGPRDHALETARYIQCWTSYRDFRTVAADCARAGLAVSSRFTRGFFTAKLRSMLRLSPLRRYRGTHIPGVDWLGFMVGRYLSSATLVIRPVHYDIGRRIAAEKSAASALRRAA